MLNYMQRDLTIIRLIHVNFAEELIHVRHSTLSDYLQQNWLLKHSFGCQRASTITRECDAAYPAWCLLFEMHDSDYIEY